MSRISFTQFQGLNHIPEYESGLSDAAVEPSGNAPFLRYLTSSTESPPEATSTPQKSIQMPSHLQFQSNLLDQDSDMQDAMRDFDSYEGDSGPNEHPCMVVFFFF